MYELLKNLDRRWVFLIMAVAVSTPILLQLSFPEKVSKLTQDAYAEVDKLKPGQKVLLAFDFDPGSAGELSPMATSLTYHCAKRGAKLYFLALWPVGPQMVEEAISKVIKADFPDMVYGRDYVNLGFKSGYEAVIKVIVTDIKKLYTTDHRGTGINSIPMMSDVKSLQDMDLIASISAGYPGAKEWVQYAKTAYPEKITVIAGCTGVQAPPLLPYVPNQLPGMIAAIKGAAEYEKLLVDEYDLEDQPKYKEGLRRMGSQLVAHVLMIVLIVAGNAIFFIGKRRAAGEARR
jgi:hypothetical protein